MGSIRPDGDAPHETDRILPGSRRPDGTMRKPVRIRAGYVPQEEVAIYQSKGALFRKGTPQAPPGCDFVDDKPNPKSKAAKKNEKRKDKKQQALKEALPDSGSTPELVESQCAKGVDRAEVADYTRVAIQQLAALEVSEVGDTSKVAINKMDLEKRIRAIRKKIRLFNDNGAQGGVIVEPSKEKKLELWQQELKDLEARLAELSCA